MNKFCSESTFISLKVRLRYPIKTISYIVLYCKKFIMVFSQMIH